MAVKTITLNLNKQLILEAVKTDTYLTGQAEKSVDGANNARSYNEQAGDDVYHERKLLRTLYGAVGRFEVELADFIDSSSGSISNTLSDNNDTFTITFTTSSRFNEGLITPMSQLAQEYLINRMIAMWWMAMKPDLANAYTLYYQDSLASIRKCLTKTAPQAQSATFDSIQGTSV